MTTISPDRLMPRCPNCGHLTVAHCDLEACMWVVCQLCDKYGIPGMTWVRIPRRIR